MAFVFSPHWMCENFAHVHARANLFNPISLEHENTIVVDYYIRIIFKYIWFVLDFFYIVQDYSKMFDSPLERHYCESLMVAFETTFLEIFSQVVVVIATTRSFGGRCFCFFAFNDGSRFVHCSKSLFFPTVWPLPVSRFERLPLCNLVAFRSSSG